MRRYAALGPVALALALAAPAGAATTNVEVGSEYFRAADITITAGDTVRWNWVAGGHNVRSTSGPESFQLPYHNRGESDQRTFNVPGIYRYVCQPHDDEMRGTIRVVEATAPPAEEPPAEEPPAEEPPAEEPPAQEPPVDDEPAEEEPVEEPEDDEEPVDDDDEEQPPAADPTPPQDSGPANDQAPRNETPAAPDGGGPVASADPAPEVPVEPAAEGFAVPSLGPVDTAAPTLRSVRVANGTLRFRASEAGTLVVRARRLGSKSRQVLVRRFTLRRGANVIFLRDYFLGDRYRLSLQALDARGNAGRPTRLRVTLRR